MNSNKKIVLPKKFDEFSSLRSFYTMSTILLKGASYWKKVAKEYDNTFKIDKQSNSILFIGYTYM